MAKYKIEAVKEFKKQLKKLAVSDAKLVLGVIERIAKGEILEPKHKDHKLKGEFAGCRECHVKPDLLLIYKKQDEILTLLCVAVGSHSELFK